MITYNSKYKFKRLMTFLSIKKEVLFIGKLKAIENTMGFSHFFILQLRF